MKLSLKLKIKLKKKSLFEVGILICFMLIPLSGMLSSWNNIFAYVDEMLMVIVIAYSVRYINRLRKINPLTQNVKLILSLVIAVYFIGLVSNCINTFQTSYYAIFIDMFSWGKLIFVFPLGYFALTEKNIKSLYSSISFCGKFMICWNLILVILNQVQKLDLGGKGIRFGIVSYSIPYTHVAFTSGFFAMIASILMLNYEKNKMWIILSIIICLSTARFKAFGWIVFIIIAMFTMKKKVKILPFVIAVCAVVVVAGDAIEIYFFNRNASRSMELMAGINLAKDCFPLGGGFATFGTIMSFRYYSSAYVIYGLSNRYGYMKTAGSFIGDGGWSTQIGQLGYIGAIIFALIIFKICKCCIENGNKNQNTLPALSIVTYILIASISDRMFISELAPFFALAMLLICRYNVDSEYEPGMIKIE